MMRSEEAPMNWSNWVRQTHRWATCSPPLQLIDVGPRLNPGRWM
jgi:hypothetical protein